VLSIIGLLEFQLLLKDRQHLPRQLKLAKYYWIDRNRTECVEPRRRVDIIYVVARYPVPITDNVNQAMRQIRKLLRDEEYRRAAHEWGIKVSALFQIDRIANLYLAIFDFVQHQLTGHPLARPPPLFDTFNVNLTNDALLKRFLVDPAINRTQK
jgi:hypothetical protein